MYHILKALRLVPLRPLYYISQTPNWACIGYQLSVFVPCLYSCCHGPAKWTFMCCSWPSYNSNNSSQATDATLPATNLKTPIFEGTLSSVTTGDITATKKSVKSFLDHLTSQMDHTVTQWCWIYQLEDEQTKPGETPDELVDHLRAFANRCNFPTDKEKEWNIQFHLVYASQTVSWSRNCLPLTSRPQQLRCLKHAGLT